MQAASLSSCSSYSESASLVKGDYLGKGREFFKNKFSPFTMLNLLSLLYYTRFLNRKAWANSVDPDWTL